jgi:serine/threonine protein kinase
MVGKYKVLKVIGQGGFGTTYLAEHEILKKKVVIKQSNFRGPVAQQIMLDEASLLWDVNHWGLPTVKDVLLTEDGDVLLVMNFIEGKELFEYVKTNGPVDSEIACWITQRIVSALYYLHFRGIVHRDVKPANIIVNFSTHIATLVDFGLSKLKPDGSPDPSGYTPFFGAPEQVAGKAPIPESDIYSLGMTMIYILGGDIRSMTLPDDVPELLKDFIYAMIREDPMERPKSCKGLNEELGEIRKKLFKRAHSM